MSEKQIDIQIFGRILRISCPIEQQDALNQAATLLNTRLHDLKNRTKINNTEQLIFITSLNICHELMQEKCKLQEHIINIEKCINILQKILEK